MAEGMVIAPTNKRTVRGTPNPLDKATIVSIYPRAIKETKHTITPGIFEIAAGSFENPSILTVGPSSWWREIDEKMPLIEIPSGAIVMAESIVNDFCNGMIEYIPNVAGPGLFFVPGELSVVYIKKEYSQALKDANERQNRWFSNLLNSADADWAKTNGNPKSISDFSRMAAHALGQTDRPWMKNIVDVQKIACVACGNLRNPAFPICPNCNRIVDVELAKKLGIVEATK